MTAECQPDGVATRKDIQELRKTVVEQFKEAGFEDPSEQAIQSRLQTLLDQQGLHLQKPRKRQVRLPSLRSTFSKGLAFVQTFCQGKAHEAEQRQAEKRKGIPDPDRPNEIPYYFAAIPDDYMNHFARYLPPSATVVLRVLWRDAEMETRVWRSLTSRCWCRSTRGAAFVAVLI